MSDLSLNPCTWSFSNIAEAAVEGLTGSEAAGDIAGMWGAVVTGDFGGLIEQTGDLAQNIASNLSGRGGPGSTKSPSECCPKDKADGKDGAGKEGGYTLENCGGDIQTFIMMIMLEAIKNQRTHVGDLATKFKEVSDKATDTSAELAGIGDGKGTDSATATKNDGDAQTAKDEVSTLLQQANDTLKQFQTLLTQLLSSFAQSSSSIIQNIR